MTAHRYDAPVLESVIGAEAANVIRVTLTTRRRESPPGILLLQGFLSDVATGIGISAAAPSGGIAVGTKGRLIAEEVANLRFTMQTDAAGQIELDITEVAAKTFYLVVIMPTGEQKVIGPITFV